MEAHKVDKHKKAECHKTIAGYLKEASNLHLEAAKHCEADDCGKAAIDTLKALGYICAAKKLVKKMAKCCAGIPCCDEKCGTCHK